MTVVSCVVGLAFLIAAGNLIVIGARSIAVSFGIDDFIIGATVVAVGTSVPELATTVIAKLRGHDEIGLGTILGSNIFNGLCIVAVAATIHPIAVNWREVAATLAFGLVALIFIYPRAEASLSAGVVYCCWYFMPPIWLPSFNGKQPNNSLKKDRQKRRFAQTLGHKR